MFYLYYNKTIKVSLIGKTLLASVVSCLYGNFFKSEVIKERIGGDNNGLSNQSVDRIRKL